MQKVKLTNPHRHLTLLFSMRHDVVCAAMGECYCRTVKVPKAGQAKPVLKNICQTIRVGPGQTSEELPVAVLKIGQVEQFRAKHGLKVDYVVASIQRFPAGR